MKNYENPTNRLTSQKYEHTENTMNNLPKLRQNTLHTFEKKNFKIATDVDRNKCLQQIDFIPHVRTFFNHYRPI